MMAVLHRATYETDSCVRGFHIYQDIWTPVIGEELLCEREEGNPNDRYAVPVLNVSMVVGHVARHISTLCNVFLRRGGSISCIITGRRLYSRDLPQGGMEIPCKYRFVGSPKELNKVESCLHGQTYKGLLLFTGLDYWTELFSFFGQVSVFILALTPSPLNHLNHFTMPQKKIFIKSPTRYTS